MKITKNKDFICEICTQGKMIEYKNKTIDKKSEQNIGSCTL